MREEEFDQLVERACAKIPRRFRRRLDNVVFVVEREPRREQIERAGARGATLLGLYQGRPLTARSVFDQFAMPDQIVIFQGPHERLARDRAHLEELVNETVWHEVAHYFGMNERQVRRAERRRSAFGRRHGA